MKQSKKESTFYFWIDISFEIVKISLSFSFIGDLSSNSEKLIPDVSKIEKVFDEQKSSNKSKGNNDLTQTNGNSPRCLICHSSDKMA